MRSDAIDIMMSVVYVCMIMLLALGAGTSTDGLEWLAAKALEEGVVTLPSGLQYKVVTRGSGAAHPTPDSPCVCHYRGALISGEEFDSSYSRGAPTTFAPNQVIGGWTEAMQMMVEGDIWELYIPSELAYGERGSPPKIPPQSALVFTIEMITIKGDSVPAQRCDVHSGEGCTPKELKFIEDARAKYVGNPDLAGAELTRLNGLSAKSASIAPGLRNWIHTRIQLLSALTESPAAAGIEEL